MNRRAVLFVVAAVFLGLIAWLAFGIFGSPGNNPPSGSTLEDIKFRHEIGQTVLEKLVIAALVALLGLWTTRLVERFKTREAYIAAFAQKHINYVSDVWELIYEWEACINDASVTETEQYGSAARTETAAARSRDLAENLRRLLWKQRFWLGQPIYARFVNYHNALHPYLDALVLQDRKTAETLKGYLDKCKQDIMDVLNADLT